MAYVLSPPPWQQFIDPNGIPYAGGKLYTFAAGTTDASPVFRDNVGTPHANPIILDALGACTIFLPSNAVAYKYVLHDANDVPIRTQDNVSVAFPEGTGPTPGLNADLLDGIDSTGFLQLPLAGSAAVPNLNADKLDGLDSTDFVRSPLVVQAFPVSSIFISVVPTNPNTLLGYGVWVAFATGRVLVGFDAAQPSVFTPVEGIGGAVSHWHQGPPHAHAIAAEAAHTHAIAADGSHTHTVPAGNINNAGDANSFLTIDAQQYLYFKNGISQQWALQAIGQSGPAAMGLSAPARTSTGDGTHSHGGATGASPTHSHGGATGVEGAGATTISSSLQPYIVVYMWKRTA